MSEARRVAIYAGSFDPVTVGHEEIIRRALHLVDRLVVGVAHRSSQAKTGLFSVEQRLELIREVFAQEPRVDAVAFSGLLVEFARERGATLLIRGLRGSSDFDYEAQMARMNRSLAPELETIFLASSPERSFVSASLVREIAGLGGDVGRFVSPCVVRMLPRAKAE